MGGAETHAVAPVLATNRRAPPASAGAIISGLAPGLPRQHIPRDPAAAHGMPVHTRPVQLQDRIHEDVVAHPSRFSSPCSGWGNRSVERRVGMHRHCKIGGIRRVTATACGTSTTSRMEAEPEADIRRDIKIPVDRGSGLASYQESVWAILPETFAWNLASRMAASSSSTGK